MDLHLLPKVRDSWSYLYVEHCRVDQEDHAVALHDQMGKTPVPCASLTLLMLGPGTTVTHAAIRALADNGCLVAWTGEEGVRFYAQGIGETRGARHMLHQAQLCCDPILRLRVVKRMYQMRFAEQLGPELTLQQIRGKEGMRVRAAYAEASRQTGVAWTGRAYLRNDWRRADPINRALSAANSCLYGVCHAAIISLGYSPALGFVHTGKMLSFVYDIADLYKAELTIPAAFAAVAAGEHDLERRVRQACRDAFHRGRLLDRIVVDLDHALMVDEGLRGIDELEVDGDAARPGELWDPEVGAVTGGQNYADEPSAEASTGEAEWS